MSSKSFNAKYNYTAYSGPGGYQGAEPKTLIGIVTYAAYPDKTTWSFKSNDGKTFDNTSGGTLTEGTEISSSWGFWGGKSRRNRKSKKSKKRKTIKSRKTIRRR